WGPCAAVRLGRRGPCAVASSESSHFARPVRFMPLPSQTPSSLRLDSALGLPWRVAKPRATPAHPSRCRQDCAMAVASFDQAREAVAAGTPPEEATQAIVAAMTPEERLWCLDGDAPTWAGLAFLAQD